MQHIQTGLTDKSVKPAPSMKGASMEEMAVNAENAAEFLKALANKHRLMILCRLVMGPSTVTELERVLSLRQSSVSQQMARLRLEGFVKSERNGKAVKYSLADERVTKIVKVLYEMYCGDLESTQLKSDRNN